LSGGFLHWRSRVWSLGTVPRSVEYSDVVESLYSFCLCSLLNPDFLGGENGCPLRQHPSSRSSQFSSETLSHDPSVILFSLRFAPCANVETPPEDPPGWQGRFSYPSKTLFSRRPAQSPQVPPRWPLQSPLGPSA